MPCFSACFGKKAASPSKQAIDIEEGTWLSVAAVLICFSELPSFVNICFENFWELVEKKIYSYHVLTFNGNSQFDESSHIDSVRIP